MLADERREARLADGCLVESGDILLIAVCLFLSSCHPQRNGNHANTRHWQ
jgi:hypothetical protein